MNLHTVVPAALVTILLVGSASARPPAEDQPYFSGDARYHAVDIGAVERNLTENLRSENDGVIGSSIAQSNSPYSHCPPSLLSVLLTREGEGDSSYC